MSKLLTKEQAEWLIENIRKGRTEQLFGRNAYHEDTIMNTINQCAEKEFPEFEISLGAPWSVRLRNAGGITWIDTLKDGEVKQSSLSFEIEEFKQFTEGCNKMVEWLEDQA